jgi:hypothetical protein
MIGPPKIDWRDLVLMAQDYSRAFGGMQHHQH